MFDFDCQYRIGTDSPATCVWQSERLGHVVKTSYLFCKNCTSNVHKNGDNDKDFLKKCFYRRYNKNFFEKLSKKYINHTKILCPKNWSMINDKFAELKKLPWFIDIGLTGSYIVDGVNNHKDIDIVFWINNIQQYSIWLENNHLPEYMFDNLKTDYYIFLKPYYQFFVSLWPNQKKIFTSKYFSANISTTEDLEIIYDNSHEKLLNYGDIQIFKN